MSIIGSNVIAGASGQAGYNLTNSLRFRNSATPYLNRTPASTGNRQIMTFSFWMKRGLLTYATNYLNIFTAYPGASNIDLIAFSPGSDSLLVWFNGQSSANLITTQVFRDPSAWYHIVVAIDTTQATAANRIKMYVNGTQITSFSTATYPSQNYNTYWNSSSYAAAIGTNLNGPQGSFDGYLTEINFIDGQALTPSSFGSTNSTTGVWQPAKYTGTYGTNGYYLNFNSIALTSGSNTGLGKDSSGNGNYWNTNNISVTAGTTYDAMTDVPTNTSATVANYPTLNPLGGQGGTWSNGNLQYTGPTAWKNTLSTIMLPSTGKFYAEATLLGTGFANNDSYATFGVGTTLGTVPSSNNCSIGDGGDLNNFGTYTTGSGKLSTGDIVSLSIDRDANTYNYRVNNTTRFSGTIGTTAGADLFFNYWSYSSAYGQMAVNFGQRPFTYTPPTGFVALNTYNLPTPTILQGNKYMDATLYTGNGTSGKIVTNSAGFKPDFVWIKDRSAPLSHGLFDSVRGAGYYLISNSTAAQSSFDAQSLQSFNSNGFTVGSTGDYNSNNNPLVGWQWQAGQGSTSSNTSGSITSTVSVNTTAGFSVVTYTGTGANATVGHGLGVAPKMVIWFNRSSTNQHIVYHVGLTSYAYYVYLSSTAAQSNAGSSAQTAIPSSTVLSLLGTSSETSTNGNNYVAYCWAEIAGFSKFGSYTGNGSADGPFVYLGFRPKFVMIKRYDAGAESWTILDTSVNTYNLTYLQLFPSSSGAEVNGSGRSPSVQFDYLSNGFKLRGANGEVNGSGWSYIYAAFAENPFKNANAR